MRPKYIVRIKSPEFTTVDLSFYGREADALDFAESFRKGIVKGNISAQAIKIDEVEEAI